MSQNKPTHSLNATLNALRIANLQSEFITVSPVTGVGDYSSIADAVDAGHKYIFVKSGTYNETRDIVINGQNLIGESPESTIIALTDNSIEFKNHDATNSYDTGTAQLVNNSTTVNGGGGTLWDSGANAASGFAEPWLIIRGMALPIDSFTNDTTLDLKEEYRGSTQTGNYYIIDAMNIGSLFTGFTVKHTPAAGTVCMKISGIGVTIERNIFQATRLTTSHVIQTGVDTLNVAAKIHIENNRILSGTIGIELKNAHDCHVLNNSFENQNDHAIRTNTDDHDCYKIKIGGNTISGCTSTAIEIDTSTADVEITNNVLLYLMGDGITGDGINGSIIGNRIGCQSFGGETLTFTNSSQVRIANNRLVGNSITLTIVNSQFTGNQYQDGTVTINGNANVITDNNIEQGKLVVTGADVCVNDNRFSYGLSDETIQMTGNHGMCNDNLIEECDGHGIHIEGEYITINGNKVGDAGADGIWVEANYCSIEGNLISNSGSRGINSVGNYCTINNNSIHTTGNVGILGLGYTLKINGNELRSISGWGIYLQSAGGGSDGISTIQNNTIEGASIGIYSNVNDAGCRIEGNMINTTTTLGIQLNGIGADDWSINGNSIFNAGTTGIIIDEGGQHSTVNNNLIKSPGTYGIRYSVGFQDTHSVIEGNTINGAGSVGIFLDREGQAAGDRNDHMIVIGNNVHNSTGDGILCETLRCIISSNRCDDGGADGICVRNGDQSVVIGNGCDNNTTNGIDIEATADRIIITNNVCLNNGANQILNNGTNTVSANNIVV